MSFKRLRISGFCSRMNARKSLFPLGHALHRNAVEVAAGAGVDAHHLVDHVHRLVLALLQQLHHAVAAIELRLRGGVQLGAQLGERFQFAEGGQVQTQTAGDALTSWP